MLSDLVAKGCEGRQPPEQRWLSHGHSPDAARAKDDGNVAFNANIALNQGRGAQLLLPSRQSSLGSPARTQGSRQILVWLLSTTAQCPIEGPSSLPSGIGPGRVGPPATLQGHAPLPARHPPGWLGGAEQRRDQCRYTRHEGDDHERRDERPKDRKQRAIGLALVNTGNLAGDQQQDGNGRR